MSLLLNALKKAEEGDESQVDQQQPSSTEQKSIGSSQSVEGVSASNTETPQQASNLSISKMVDMDADIDSKEASDATHVAANSDFSKKQRVNAARVFGANNVGDGEGGSKKFIATLVAIGALGAGGFGAHTLGFTTGLIDLYNETIGGSQLETDSGVVDIAVPSDTLTVSDDLVLLPIPAVDIQSEIDFYALQQPENSRDNLGDKAYVEKIALLTGFTIGAEEKKKREEEKALITKIAFSEIGDGSDEAEGLGQTDVEQNQIVEEVIYTADISRERKIEIDATTGSEELIEVELKSGGSTSAELVEKQETVAQIDVNVSSEGLKRKKQLEKAIRLYYDGSYAEAEIIYRNILSKSPTDINALRGLAQLSVSTGRYQSAVATYLNILKFYPNDPVAISELSNLKVGGSGSFYEIEALLKKSLGKASNVDSRVHFALGNLYAENELWAKSQDSYFQALSLDSKNPDYAYNLAVVLDYLNKPSLAVQYYKVALEFSDGVLVGFNKVEVRSRIKDLLQ